MPPGAPMTYAPQLGRSLCVLGRYDEAEPLARLGRELGSDHEAGFGQILFAVAGSGWVAGGDGQRMALAEGRGRIHQSRRGALEGQRGRNDRAHDPGKGLHAASSLVLEPTPLPQTTTRPHRLHHPQKRVSIDIGATLAQTRVLGVTTELPESEPTASIRDDLRHARERSGDNPKRLRRANRPKFDVVATRSLPAGGHTTVSTARKKEKPPR